MHPQGHYSSYPSVYESHVESSFPSQTRYQEPPLWSSPNSYNAHPTWTMNTQNYASEYATTHSSWAATDTMNQVPPYHIVPNHAYHHHQPSVPLQDTSRWGYEYQKPLKSAQTTEIVAHTYERLPSADKDVVDAWLVKDSEKRVYRCRANGCGREFSSKDNARVHVHGKHLGESKLFRCVLCRTEFASEDGAKRHRDTATAKSFSCTYCSNTYARKDYRDLHQKKCTSRRG